MGFFNFSPHKYTISLPLLLSQLCLSLSLFIFLCFCALCFRRSCCCCGCAPNYRVPSLPCACRLPPFFFFFSFFYVTPHLAFRNVELTFAHTKKKHTMWSMFFFGSVFFGPDFPPRGKKKKKKKISPVKVAKRQSFPFQFSVSLCHCVSSIILTCFTICRVLRSMFYVCFLYSMYLCLSVSFSLSLSLLYR